MESTNRTGQQIGNYRITREINSGPFGSVYLAEHLYIPRWQVAIKLLHTYLGSQDEREQFTQEAQFLAQLEHPSILPLIDFGFHDGQPYLITRYAAGDSRCPKHS